MNKYLLWILVALFTLGFMVRLYRFDNPVADWHAFRQSDTNAVSQIFVNEGINFLYPKYFDISNVQSGFDNPHGFRFVEFPIYNATQAFLFGVFGVLSLEQWGRLITIIASLAAGLFVYLLTRKYAGDIAGLFSLIFYLFLPYSIFYGRVILPDPSMTTAIIAGIYFFDKWLDKFQKANSKSQTNTKYKIQNTKYFILAMVFTALAFLIKPFALFFVLPMVYLAYKKFGFSFIKKWQLWILGILTVLPFIAWRIWVSQFPEGIPVSAWLFNGNDIRFRPSFFRWIFFERITKLILGYCGIFFAIIGVVKLSSTKNAFFFGSFAVSTLIYLFVIATGNVQHDYYQILIIPTIAMFAGIGAAFLFGLILKKTNFLSASLICFIIIASAFYLSWIQVRDYFNINDWGMVRAGKMANEILPKDAVIIAPYDGSTTLLNIAARRGWPVFQVAIEELIDLGATYMVIANPTESDFNGFGATYEQVSESKDYLILKLTN